MRSLRVSVGMWVQPSLIASALLVAGLASAQGSDPDAYFNKHGASLSAVDRAALAAATKSQTNYVKAVGSPDGSVRFAFRGQVVSVVCAVLQVCDIELQPGELVNNMNIGDPRISVMPAVSGSGTNQTQHLIIKPLDVGIDTSLIVTTDRRTYFFRLGSQRHEFMPRVTFTYDDLPTGTWVQPTPPVLVEPAKSTPPPAASLGGDSQSLNFSYQLSGRAPWKPVRVYSDGVHTFIQMPKTMSQTEAPTLLIVRAGKEQVLVNYRVQGDRYIVDSVFEKAILIAGVGRHQTRITIDREGETG